MKKIYATLVTTIFLAFHTFAQSNGVTNYTCSIPSSGSNLSLRSAFTIDNFGNKWVGFNSGTTTSFQLVRYNGTTWDSFPHIPNRKVNALAVDAANNLWIASYGGLVKYDGSNFSYFNAGGSGIASDTIYSVACGGGNVYLGTNHGLSVYNGTSFTNYNHATSGLSHDTVSAITYENSGAIWLGNPKGLEKFNGSNFTNYSLGTVGTGSVNCIYIDQTNNKWIGTNNYGVVKYDNTNFQTMQQLFSPYAIIGGYWPSVTQSICKGPSGGVSFELWNSPSSASGNGLLEIKGGNTNFYTGVGYYNFSAHSIFQFDQSSGKIFFVNTTGGINKIFLYSFDTSMYVNNQYPILSSNSAYLDINKVSALITANSDMGWDQASPRYYVPNTSTVAPIYAASTWIGGYHNGTLHLGAMTYRQNGMDFFPGPLDTIQDTIDVATQHAFNRVWKINRFDIANFIYNWSAGNVQSGAYVPPADFLSWPAHGPGAYSKRLAPFVDVNGNGIYDPINDGDYPLIKGDQMVWRVFNDKGNKHSESGGDPMGIEIQASAYAFVCPGLLDSNRVLNYTTFYNYKIVNRSANRYDSCFITNWVDSDLGNYQDDYIGSDVTNNFGYTFNGDNYDEGGYLTDLPAFSCNILGGPVADIGDGRDNNNNGIVDEPGERCGLNSLICYANTGDPLMGNPNSNSPQQYYNFMSGKWKNGVPMTYGGNGTSATGTVCHHIYPGLSDPNGSSMGGTAAAPVTPPGSYGATGWTQAQAGVVKNDMRFLTGTGPFTILPGNTYEFDFAYVFSQDSADCDTMGNECILPYMKQDNMRIKNWFDHNSFPSCLSLAGVGIRANENPFFGCKIYPNPTADHLYIEFRNAKEKVTIEIMDLQGKIVKAGIFNNASKYITIPVNDLESGFYTVRVCSEGISSTKKFVKE